MLKVKVRRPKLDEQHLYKEERLLLVNKIRQVWVPVENSGEAIAAYVKQLEEKNRKYWARRNESA